MLEQPCATLEDCAARARCHRPADEARRELAHDTASLLEAHRLAAWMPSR
jgi:hypothetical protein